MAIAGRAESSKRLDTRHRACLGPHIAIGRRATKPLAERAVASGDGQRGKQGLVGLRVMVVEAQEVDEEVGRDIIVEREATTIGRVVLRRIKASRTHHLVDHLSALARTCTPHTRALGQLVEDRLGMEVVALLHHPLQHPREVVGLLG